MGMPVIHLPFSQPTYAFWLRLITARTVQPLSKSTFPQEIKMQLSNLPHRIGPPRLKIPTSHLLNHRHWFLPRS
jgi:hypothetical protein